MTTSNGCTGGTLGADLADQLGQFLGAGQAGREQAVPARARCTGRRCGHSPATHTGILGRCTGSGSNSPDQYR